MLAEDEEAMLKFPAAARTAAGWSALARRRPSGRTSAALAADVHRDVEHRALHHADQLALGVRLSWKCRPRSTPRDEREWLSWTNATGAPTASSNARWLKLSKKKPRVVAEHARLDDEHAGDRGGRDAHGQNTCLAATCIR